MVAGAARLSDNRTVIDPELQNPVGPGKSGVLDLNGAPAMRISYVVTILMCLCTNALARGLTEAPIISRVGPEGGIIASIAVDPQNSNVVYAATATGVFKSNDGGTTWGNSGLMGFAVGNVTIDPQNPATVYASMVGYIFKSIDAGATWNQLAGWNGLHVLAIDPRNQGTLYVTGGSPGVVLKSSDGGATWQGVNMGIPAGGPSILTPIAIDPHNANTVYSAGYLPGPHPTLTAFKSTNGARSRQRGRHNGSELADGNIRDPLRACGHRYWPWTIDGVRAHQDPENHTGGFGSGSATITVAP